MKTAHANLILALGLSAILLLTTGTITLANEAPKRNASELSQIATEQMSEDLSLNKDQLSQAKQINMQFFARLQAMREEKRSKRIARLRELKQAVRERDNSMQAILSKQQYATYKKIAAERRSELRELIKARRQAQ